MKLNLDYIAGFIDGEGCISASTRGLRLIITNTNKEILEEIQEYFGEGKLIGRIRVKIRGQNDNYRKKCYQLVLWNRHAERVLLLLIPHLRLKKKEAELGIMLMSTYGTRGAEKGSFGRIRLPQSILDIRSTLCFKIKEAKCV